MSLSQDFAFTCPECGKDFSASIWLSVNTSLSPELKEQILDDTLNELCCSHCGFTTAGPELLLYHDMEKRLMFYVSPYADEESRLKAAEQAEELLADDLAKLTDDTSIYVLDSMDDLRGMIVRLESADGAGMESITGEEWKEIVDLMLEPALPWPLDHKCVCGEEIPIVCFCQEPGVPVNLNEYEPDLQPDLAVECGKCSRQLAGFQCAKCSRMYGWNQGVVQHATLTSP